MLDKNKIKEWLYNFEDGNYLIELIKELSDYTYKFDNIICYENDDNFYEENFDSYLEVIKIVEYLVTNYANLYYSNDAYVQKDDIFGLRSYSEDEYINKLRNNHLDLIVDELIELREDIEIPYEELQELLGLFDEEEDYNHVF